MVFHGTVPCCLVQYCIVYIFHGTIWCCMEQYCIVEYCMVFHGQYSIIIILHQEEYLLGSNSYNLLGTVLASMVCSQYILKLRISSAGRHCV